MSPGFQMWCRWLASSSEVQTSVCGSSASDLHGKGGVLTLFWTVNRLAFRSRKIQSAGRLACSSSSPLLQALGYLPPELPSSLSIWFGNNEEMLVTAKIQVLFYFQLSSLSILQ